MSELILGYPSLIVYNLGQGTSYTTSNNSLTEYIVKIYGQTGAIMNASSTGYGTTFIYPYGSINSASYTNS
jgi:hypothetical protein